MWTQQGPKLVGTGGIGNASQTYSPVSIALSADGNTAILGWSADDSNVGAMWVWTRARGMWTQQGPKLVGKGAVSPLDGGSGTKQGNSVALSADGNTALVGGPGGTEGIGALWLWTRSDAGWAQQDVRLAHTFNPRGFGNVVSVALSAKADIALVGGSDALGAASWVVNIHAHR